GFEYRSRLGAISRAGSAKIVRPSALLQRRQSEVNPEPELLAALVERGQRLSEAGRLEAPGVAHEVVGIERVEHLPEPGDAKRAELENLAQTDIRRAFAVAATRIARLGPFVERIGVELKARGHAVRYGAAVGRDAGDLKVEREDVRAIQHAVMAPIGAVRPLVL